VSRVLFVTQLSWIVFTLFFLQLNVYALSDAVNEKINENNTNNLNPEKYYSPKIASITEIVESSNFQTEFFQLRSNLNIFIIDFATLEEQGVSMNRVALLIESSNAPKEWVVNDEEMEKLILETRQNTATLYLGHDVRIESLAYFFNMVKKNSIKINQYEEKLKNTLLKNYLMRFDEGKYQAIENKALVTVSKLQKNNPGNDQDETITQDMRQYIIQHEISHGEYFTNQKYRQYCQDFWETKLTEAQRKSFRNYLDNKYYDKNQEDLMINEFQAYLVYTGINFGDLFNEGTFETISADEVLKIRYHFISGSTSSLPVYYKD